MTADLDLDALTRLAEAATPGPWVAQYGGVTTEVDGHVSQSVIYAAPCPNDCGDESIVDRIAPVDAAYIAAVDPATVVALVERLRAAEEVIERVRVDQQWDSDALDGTSAIVERVIDVVLAAAEPGGPIGGWKCTHWQIQDWWKFHADLLEIVGMGMCTKASESHRNATEGDRHGYDDRLRDSGPQNAANEGDA